MYEKFLKRVMDFVLSLMALLILSPVFIVLIVAGAIVMKGNPFFVQPRPGKNERIFNLIKFRSMTCEKDENGKLLPDEKRLTPYGRFLRSSSLDELPEFINILKGDMSFVGPRPLLTEYIPYYTPEERKRHSVRPGLTGVAQINGRNFISWDKRLAFDIQYVNNITLWGDICVVFKTVTQFIKKQDVAVDTNKVEPNFAAERRAKRQDSREVSL